MLTYPLAWNMSVDIMHNDLDFYETPITTDRTPAMTHSWFTVGYKWVEDEVKMKEYFRKSYEDYMILPFRVNEEVYFVICYKQLSVSILLQVHLQCM